MVRIVIALALSALLAVPATAAAAQPEGIIVKRRAGLDRDERLAVREDADVTLRSALKLPDTEVVVPEPGKLDAALDALNANPDVEYAEADSPVTPLSADTYSGYLWGLENTGQTVDGQAGTADADIDAPEAWATTRGAGATVAVVDAGIDTTAPDLAGQVTGNPGERGNGRETNGIDDDGNGYVDDWQGWDFVHNDNTIEPDNIDHATHVAGTIAALADNHLGVAGVAPEAKVISVKVFGSTASESTIAQAFDYAGRLGVPVVNASLGGSGYSTTVTNVINAHPNTLYVVAAGNSGANAAGTYPCNSTADNLVCVGASDNQDHAASFSNYSASVVDLFAPGVDILSTLPGGSYGFMDGTSMATPHVAGTAALLAAAAPASTALQRKAALLASVDAKPAFSGKSLTGGRLNAAAAIASLLGSPAPAPTPTPTPTATPVVTPIADPDRTARRHADPGSDRHARPRPPRS